MIDAIKYRILGFIDDMFSDTSVASHVTYEALSEIRDKCDILMETLEEDL